MSRLPCNRIGKLASLFLMSSILALPSMPVFAHHGWAWAEEQQSQIKGTIQAISMDPPHPTLRVRADDGAVWRVELGNPRKTERSGFNADSANVGDAITVLGNRSLQRSEMHMKAVRITINGRNYDLYPERIRAD